MQGWSYIFVTVVVTMIMILTCAATLSTTRWLIAIAYWLAGGFIKSGLGNRIAYSMVRLFTHC